MSQLGQKIIVFNIELTAKSKTMYTYMYLVYTARLT